MCGVTVSGAGGAIMMDVAVTSTHVTYVDGMWGPWKMLSKKGESGVWWRAELQPAYHVFKGAQGVVQGAAGGVGGLFNKMKR